MVVSSEEHTYMRGHIDNFMGADGEWRKFYDRFVNCDYRSI